MSAAPARTSPGTDAPVRTHTVIVYSDDPAVRDGVRTAVGRRPAADLGRVEWVECTTGPDLIRLVDKGGIDLVVLDGEAWPTGGLGLARQMKDELVDAPPPGVVLAPRGDRRVAERAMGDPGVPPPRAAPPPGGAGGGSLLRAGGRAPVAG